ncbi:hypothetical protein [Nocardia gipuzkoensis]
MSTRQWLDWHRANAVTVFGVEFLRAVARELAADGIAPVNDWVEQSWHTRAGWPMQTRGFMDPTGEPNCAGLVSKLIYPSKGVPADYVTGDILPRVLENFRTERLHVVGRPGQGEPGQHMIELKRRWVASTARYRNDQREIVLTSPYYYCGYMTAQVPSTFGSRHWPLDPAAEREPVVTRTGRLRKLKHDEVPAAADAVLADVRGWGEWLGFTVGSSHPGGRWRTGEEGYDRYTLTAPVTFAVDAEELFRRAQPYVGTLTVKKGSREPAGPHIHGRTALIHFRGHPELLVRITDPDADGKFVLTIDGPSFERLS